MTAKEYELIAQAMKQRDMSPLHKYLVSKKKNPQAFISIPP